MKRAAQPGNKPGWAPESLYMKPIFPLPAALARMSLAVCVALSNGACGGAAKTPESPVHQAPGGEEAFAKGREALLRGDHTRAEQYLKLALDAGYAPEKTVLLLVHACLSSSRFRAALNYAEPHLQSHPEDKALRYLVATVQLGLGHRDGALRQLNLLAEEAPEYADTYFLRGAAHFHEGDINAQSDFERYLVLAPNGRHSAEVRSMLTDIRLAKREPKKLEWAQVSSESSDAESQEGQLR